MQQPETIQRFIELRAGTLALKFSLRFHAAIHSSHTGLGSPNLFQVILGNQK